MGKAQNLSTPNPIATAATGLIPSVSSGTILLDGSTATFQPKGAMTAIASLTGDPGTSVVAVYVSTLSSGNVRRSFFSVQRSGSLRFAFEQMTLPDIWVIPVLGCEELTFEAIGDMDATVTIRVQFLSNTPVTDLSGLATLNAGQAKGFAGSLTTISDLESNSPVVPLAADGRRIDLVVRQLLYAGETGIFSPQPVWAKERVASVYKTLDAVTVASSGTAIWTPTSTLFPRLMGYHLSTDTSGRYYLRSNASGTLVDTLRLGANWPDRPVDLGNGIPLDAADHKLFLHGPTGAVVSGKVWGQEESGT